MGTRSLTLRLTGLAAIALPLLLLDIGPGYADSRLYHTFWDLGHPLLFGVLAWLLRPLGIVNALSLTLVTAGAVEGLQALTGRTPALWDIIFSLGGALLAIGLGMPVRGLKVALMVTVAAALLPLGRNLADEVWMRAQFPVLIGEPDFLGMARWRSVPEVGEQGGRRVWEVALQSRYDGVWLRHLVGNWSGYDALEIHLGVSGPVSLTVRVDDRTHWQTGQAWSDRYNETRRLPAGEQTLRIPLQVIRQSPVGREMDMSAIQSIYLFVPSDVPHPVLLRIFSMELVR